MTTSSGGVSGGGATNNYPPQDTDDSPATGGTGAHGATGGVGAGGAGAGGVGAGGAGAAGGTPGAVAPPPPPPPPTPTDGYDPTTPTGSTTTGGSTSTPPPVVGGSGGAGTTPVPQSLTNALNLLSTTVSPTAAQAAQIESACSDANDLFQQNSTTLTQLSNTLNVYNTSIKQLQAKEPGDQQILNDPNATPAQKQAAQNDLNALQTLTSKADGVKQTVNAMLSQQASLQQSVQEMVQYLQKNNVKLQMQSDDTKTSPQGSSTPGTVPNPQQMQAQMAAQFQMFGQNPPGSGGEGGSSDDDSSSGGIGSGGTNTD